MVNGSNHVPEFSVKYVGRDTVWDSTYSLIFTSFLTSEYTVCTLSGPVFEDKSNLSKFNNAVSQGFNNMDFARYVISEGREFFPALREQHADMRAIDRIDIVKALSELTRDEAYRYVIGASVDTLNSLDMHEDLVLGPGRRGIKVPLPEDRLVPTYLLPLIKLMAIPTATKIPESKMMPSTESRFVINLDLSFECGKCLGEGKITTDEIDHIAHETRKVKVSETQKESCTYCYGQKIVGLCYNCSGSGQLYEHHGGYYYQNGEEVWVSARPPTLANCSVCNGAKVRLCGKCGGSGEGDSIRVDSYEDESYDTPIYKSVVCEDCKGSGELVSDTAILHLGQAIKAYNDSISSLNNSLSAFIPNAIQKAQDYNLLAVGINGKIEVWNSKIRTRIAEKESEELIRQEQGKKSGQRDVSAQYQPPTTLPGYTGLFRERGPIGPMDLLESQIKNAQSHSTSLNAKKMLTEYLEMLRQQHN